MLDNPPFYFRRGHIRLFQSLGVSGIDGSDLLDVRKPKSILEKPNTSMIAAMEVAIAYGFEAP